MASTRAGRTSARDTAGALFDADSVDRTVHLEVEGPAVQRIGFSEGDVTQPGSGFRIPREGVSFRLQAGDALWLSGNVADNAEPTFVYFLVTKA